MLRGQVLRILALAIPRAVATTSTPHFPPATAASPTCIDLQEVCPGFHFSSGHSPSHNKGNHTRAAL